jgi:cellulose biosynthesis protein BcsQ
VKPVESFAWTLGIDLPLLSSPANKRQMEGLTRTIEVIESVMQRFPGRLEFGGNLLTMYDVALELTREVDAEVRDFFGGIVFTTGSRAT